MSLRSNLVKVLRQLSVSVLQERLSVAHHVTMYLLSQFLQANKLARPIFNRSGAIQPRRRHATRATRPTQMELKSTNALAFPEAEAAWIKVETV